MLWHTQVNGHCMKCISRLKIFSILVDDWTCCQPTYLFIEQLFESNIFLHAKEVFSKRLPKLLFLQYYYMKPWIKLRPNSSNTNTDPRVFAMCHLSHLVYPIWQTLPIFTKSPFILFNLRYIDRSLPKYHWFAHNQVLQPKINRFRGFWTIFITVGRLLGAKKTNSVSKPKVSVPCEICVPELWWLDVCKGNDDKLTYK